MDETVRSCEELTISRVGKGRGGPKKIEAMIGHDIMHFYFTMDIITNNCAHNKKLE